MRFLKKKNVFFILSIPLFLAFLFFGFSLADNPCSNHTLSGYAWSENIGWISFSCKNNMASEDYGVDIDSATGLMSGYAWSENIGWISFNEAELTGCPSGDCQAFFSSSTNAVFGWAKALSADALPSGWDGWIKLSGTAADSSPYGVSLNDSTKELEGWAWGGNEDFASTDGIMGWVSFNCENTASCGTVDYGVEYSVRPPVAQNLVPPADSSESYCADSVSFEWEYQDPDDIYSSGYQFRVNTINDVNAANPTVDLLISGRSDSSGSVLSQPVAVKILPGDIELSYNTDYYWWVKVCNQGGACSDWTQGPDFSTAEKHYPISRIARDKKTILFGDTVQFCSTADISNPDDPCYPICWTNPAEPAIVSPDNPDWKCSVCFDAANNYQACQEAGASYYWDFSPMVEYIDYEFVTSTAVSANPQVKFFSVGKNKQIELKVTAGADYCFGNSMLNVDLPIPKWKEVSPF
jgi:hypothetical protein